MTSMTKHTLVDCFSLRARIGWQGLRSDEFKTEGPYLVTGVDFHNGRVDWDDCYHVSVDRYEQDKGIQLRENDLLVTKDGTVGKTAFVVDCPEQATLNSHIFLVRSKDGSVEPEYLYYILNSYIFADFMKNILTGTTIKGLTQGNFYKFVFEAPDVPTQKKIVEVLESIDAVIDKTRDLIQKYTSLMKGVVQDILTESIKDENTVKMGTFANALGGKRIPKGSELTIAKTAHPYIRVRDMTKPKVVELTDDFMYVEESDFHKISRYIVDAGDLIISIVGTVGAVALVGETLDKANLGSTEWLEHLEISEK
ncbi:restriction endonuclease subunit S [Clostridium sp. J1101437_171009_A5]|uniref:restriction endonuclease subunit S n=1 Tax=Clostridium sp. J1101437_171009_A5 TaxID=2787098 RepID=UPI00189B9941|nr:restriction endonuclease subunit S [Clostridium sp. J1101437_171009_A5]